MKIVADFHVHSKYSRATAKDMDLERIYVSAQLKGVDIVATGDCSHPEWFREIEEKLECAEPGLFKLKPELASALDSTVPAACRGSVRFILATEISNIYKRDGRTRKNHNLVLLPGLDAARKLNSKLEAIGNIRSDGRPILGLDARDLLELVLEISPHGLLVPAHIWTPWFSMLGSKSGFDSVKECFADLTPHIIAVETGLSSDPSMNWRVRCLEGLRLVSNSDAHSPSNIGREANLFDTDLSYYALLEALESRNPDSFTGTLEFFPEQGKYHLDGHRGCGVRLDPAKTRALNGICPACGKALTVGVLSRVEELAELSEGHRPEGARAYTRLIPLADLLAEVFQVGAKSEKVLQSYRSAVESLGKEIAILKDLPPEALERTGIPLFGEAVRRVREGRIQIEPGFDGEYGKILIFNPAERKELVGQRTLFAVPADSPAAATGPERIPVHPKRPAPSENIGLQPAPAPHAGGGLNAEQKKVVDYPAGPLLVVAGPGTGKTHTLTCRIARLIAARVVSPSGILALTFTNRAAAEMRSRLKSLLAQGTPLPLAATFHGLCWTLLRELRPGTGPCLLAEEDQRQLIAEAAAGSRDGSVAPSLKIRELHERIMRLKQRLIPPDGRFPSDLVSGDEKVLRDTYRLYQELLAGRKVLDFEDLIFEVVRELEENSSFRRMCRERFRLVFVDEYQDINHGQYRLIRALVPAGHAQNHLCVIGDPDQAVYGFRGSDAGYFRRFVEDYPGAGVVHLARNYRSTDTILKASFQVIRRLPGERVMTYSRMEGERTIGLIEAASAAAEAAAVARSIERLVGGTGFHAVDSGRVRDINSATAAGYADIAVLARTHDMLSSVAEALERSGIPFQQVSRERALDSPETAALLALARAVSGAADFLDLEKTAGSLVPGLTPKAAGRFRHWCFEKRLSLPEGLAGAARFPIAGLPRRQQALLADFATRVSDLRRELSGLGVREQLTRLSHEPRLGISFEDLEARTRLSRLIELADEAEADMEAYLARIALLIDTEFYHPRAQKTALMTMHASKGLEFPVVFIVGCEEGSIPFRRPGADPGPASLEEERRLFYVAMTRAREKLFLTRSARRRMFGRAAERAPSPFLKDIDAGLLELDSAAARPKKAKSAQLPLF